VVRTNLVEQPSYNRALRDVEFTDISLQLQETQQQVNIRDLAATLAKTYLGFLSKVVLLPSPCDKIVESYLSAASPMASRLRGLIVHGRVLLVCIGRQNAHLIHNLYRNTALYKDEAQAPQLRIGINRSLVDALVEPSDSD